MGQITIDRSQPFNPVKKMGLGWTIEEQDERSLVLTQVDLSKVCLESMLKPGEDGIFGRERLRRLKEAGYTRLDANVLMALCKNPEIIPDSWSKENVVYFDGTIFRDQSGGHHILCLHHCDCWLWCMGGFHYGWKANELSAVLMNV